ncbi:MAG: hypothetical protein GZ094_09310 [Mariniphaga sp.]|nr:hypothetical protein [Mariniphaga sp.]
MIMILPPGAGKTMLAKRIPNSSTFHDNGSTRNQKKHSVAGKIDRNTSLNSLRHLSRMGPAILMIVMQNFNFND